MSYFSVAKAVSLGLCITVVSSFIARTGLDYFLPPGFSWPDFMRGLALGACLPTVLIWLGKLLTEYVLIRAGDGGQRSIYGLEHAKLNIEVPPRSMWMNMGYWKVCYHIRTKEACF
jgi:hypothetical protein